MDYRSWLRLLKSRIKPEVKTQAREFIICRPDGALSLIYITAFGSDARAILEAAWIARYGYRVEIWQNGVKVHQVSQYDVPDVFGSDHVPTHKGAAIPRGLPGEFVPRI